MPTTLPTLPVIVIGSGFSGLAMGAQLKLKLGLDDYVIYESSPEIGGTWQANTYPGCGVDVPSIFYSLSFAPNPDFSKLFPDQPEILAYIKSVAVKFGVDKHVRVNTRYESGKWNEDTKSWTVKLRDVKTGEEFVQECTVLITAIGGLVHPNPCLIPGIDSFQGPVVHTARWKKDLDLKDKNVVIIGNGCSGTQVVPAIAPQVKNIYQFIRSPQFYLPRRNPTIHPVVRWLFRYIPFLMVYFRWLLFNLMEVGFVQFHLDKTGDRFRARAKKISDAYVEKAAPKEYWDMLKPKYMLGCKRRVFDPGYLECLHKPNVHISDDPLVTILDKEVVTKSGKRYPADVIILANGFETTRIDINVTGRNGITPEEHWAKFGGIEAYKSIACSEFPNFFMIFGPNAASGHTSVLFSIENAIDLVLRVAGPVIKQKASEVSVKYEYEKEYCDKQQKALSQRVWADCRSFYKDDKGWNFALYPWNSYTLWWRTRFPDMKAWTYGRLHAE